MTELIDHPPDDNHRKAWRKLLSGVLTLVSVWLLYCYLSRHWTEIQSLDLAAPAWILVISGSQILMMVIRGTLNSLLMQELDADVDIKTCIALGIVANLLNQILPFQPGSAYRAVYLKTEHSLSYRSFVIIFLAFQFLSILLALCVIATVGVWQIQPHRMFGIVLGGLVASLLCCTAICLLRRFKSTRLHRTFAAIRRLTSNGRLFTQIMFLMCSQRLIEALCFYAACRSIGVQASLPGSLLITSAASLTSIVSLTPNNLGLRELIYGVLSTTARLSSVAAVSSSLLMRLSALCVAAILTPFSIYYLRIRRLRRSTKSFTPRAADQVTIAADIKSENLGDRAILSAVVHELHQEGYGTVVKIGDRNSTTESVTLIDYRNPFRVLRSIHTSQRVVIGGGGIFQDDTSLRNILFFWAIGKAACALGVPFEIRRVGVSELRSRTAIYCVRSLCKQATTISVRDQGSRQLLLRYLPTECAVSVKHDYVLDYIPNYERITEEINHIAIAGDYFLVSIRPLLAHNNPRDFFDNLIKTLDSVAKSWNLRIVIVGFQASKDAKLVNQLPCDLESRVIRLESVSIDEYCMLAEHAHFIIAMRLHALILGAAVGARLIGIEYSDKIRFFLRSIACEQHTITPANIDRLPELIDLLHLEKGT